MFVLQNIINSNYHYQPTWVMIIIVLSLMILGYLFSAYNTKFNAFLNTVFSLRPSRDEYSLSHPASVFLSINFLATTSLFILQVVASKKIFASFIDFNFLSFLIIIFSLFAIYFFKIVTIRMLGFIFDRQAVLNNYTHVIFLTNQAIGIGFVPIIIFLAYGKESSINGFISAGLILLALAFSMRVGKGMIAALSDRKTTVFYLFLYLCTLEILPLLLGWKLFERLA